MYASGANHYFYKAARPSYPISNDAGRWAIHAYAITPRLQLARSRVPKQQKASCPDNTDSNCIVNVTSKLAHAAASFTAALTILAASPVQALAALDILPSNPIQQQEYSLQAEPSALAYLMSSRLEAVTKASQGLPPIPSQFPDLPEIQLPEITQVHLPSVASASHRVSTIIHIS
jgi:hypothetical protein